MSYATECKEKSLLMKRTVTNPPVCSSVYFRSKDFFLFRAGRNHVKLIFHSSNKDSVISCYGFVAHFLQIQREESTVRSVVYFVMQSVARLHSI
jgi:hypothetical protein